MQNLAQTQGGSPAKGTSLACDASLSALERLLYGSGRCTDLNRMLRVVGRAIDRTLDHHTVLQVTEQEAAVMADAFQNAFPEPHAHITADILRADDDRPC